MFDRTLSLEALEHDRWGSPPYPSGLVLACHQLRRKPVGQLAPGELRLLIGQGIGLDYLVPLALDLLETDPLVEADFYPGDLLKQVLAIDRAFWESHHELWARAGDVASAIQSLHDALVTDVLPTVVAFQRSR